MIEAKALEAIDLITELFEASDVALTVLSLLPAVVGVVEVARWVTLALRLIQYYNHIRELRKK